MHKNSKSLLFLLLLMLSYCHYITLTNINYSDNYANDTFKDNIEKNPIKTSDENNDSLNVIVTFKNSWFNNSVLSRFKYFGGNISETWNNTFTAFSGFAGVFPDSINKTSFRNQYPDAIIETNEIIETQMNYVTIQTKTKNSTLYLDGFEGDSNCSIAVLDSGVNPNHIFFPKGYDSNDLSGNIVGWENFINSAPISDDNGHGTYISSIIAGTGKDTYNSSNPTIVNLYGNTSHTKLFGNKYFAPQNYSFKIFSFNATVENSKILVNSTWNSINNGIENFWVELYYNSTLINSSQNINPDEFYSFDHKISHENRGIYDLVLTYKKITDIFPTFSYNISLKYYPEFYLENYKYFTGIANASKIVSYKIINQSGLGYTSDLISGLESILLNRSKYHIVSACLSIATLGNDVEAINTAINEVSESGILVVIAAGNSGVEGSEPLNKLALNKNAIVVGAINDKDQVTSYSSMGKEIGGGVSKPDLVAPGGSKIQGSRSIIGADASSNNTTAAYGTSISTAIVTAAINILIDAKFDDWIQWEKYNSSNLIKAILLMTASETNLNREDDPSTDIDESLAVYSPSLFLGTFGNSLKDSHEGYGRINIDAAIDALLKFIEVNQIVNGTLVSSKKNSIGPHVFARQVNLTSNTQYLFNLTVIDDSDFDIFLFSNETDEFGEPILLANSQNNEILYGLPYDFFYYTPKRDRTCFLVIKAINGISDFSLNITSNVENKFPPQLNIPEITHINGFKNTTVMSRQEFEGNEPLKNSTLNSYRFYIEYTDKDSSNAPPMEVNVSITSQNFTLIQAYPLSDNNFSEGVLYWSEYIQFTTPGIYTYFFTASDGESDVRSGNFSITVTVLNEIQQFPYEHSFNDGLGNWTYTSSSWGTLFQNNTNDNRERIYSSNWTSLYFGTHHNYPTNYSYRPNPSLEYHLNGSLISPVFNLTNLSDNTQPFAKFGIRISINKGDFVYLQINRIDQSWTTWETIKWYTNEEKEWFLDTINISQYKGSLIQFRVNISLDEKIDLTKNRGFIVDYVAIENFTNVNPPEISFNLTDGISVKKISKYQNVMFSCDYYDLDNNYPDYVLIEAYTIINGQVKLKNYTMFNAYGDWNSSSIKIEDKGIQFRKSLPIGLVSNHTFRFHVSDGIYIKSTQWFNKNNSKITIIDPNVLVFNTYHDDKAIGYSFSNINLENYIIVHYVDDILIPVENTAWLLADNTWHISEIYNKNLLHAGIGQLSTDTGDSAGYGTDWEANLITQPLEVNDDHNLYLEFNHNLSLQPIIPPYFGDFPDMCIISISVNFGKDWTILKEYTYDNESTETTEQIDLSGYDDEIVMIKFTLRSNDIDILSNLADGWLVSDIYIGYDKSTDFQEPNIKFNNLNSYDIVYSTYIIDVKISDNDEIDDSRINIYIDDENVYGENFKFDEDSGILKYKWDTTQYENGEHEIKVIAYDDEGNKIEKTITVIVDNSLLNVKSWPQWTIFLIIGVTIGIISCIILIKNENFKKIRFFIRKRVMK